jgi:hypothetical protein
MSSSLCNVPAAFVGSPYRKCKDWNGTRHVRFCGLCCGTRGVLRERVSRQVKGWNVLRSSACAAAATSRSQNAASSVPSAGSPVAARGPDSPATQMATNQPAADSGVEPVPAAGVTAAVAMSSRGAGAAPAGTAGAVSSAGLEVPARSLAKSA